MEEPIAWKGRNKSQAVLHCSSCYLLWYGVVAVSGVMLSSLGPSLPAALHSQAGRACHASGLLFLLSSSIPNCLHTWVHFSFWLHDLKAAAVRIWAHRIAKRYPGLGPSPQADVVMADGCHARPWGGCMGMECGLDITLIW